MKLNIDAKPFNPPNTTDNLMDVFDKFERENKDILEEEEEVFERVREERIRQKNKRKLETIYE